MANIKGTKRKEHFDGFAGESQARNRYDYYASVAKKEGYVQIADIFAGNRQPGEGARQEVFKFLEGGEVEISAAFPAGVIETPQRI